MDCEKFETMLIDELYGELDELNSAASKRHVAGCARCASLLGGLKATRRLAVLPTIEPPADLESRILAAEKEARKVVPLSGRLSRAVSRAGSWAMRPQTQMAAVFLLMVGASAALLRSRSLSSKAEGAAMIVTENGAPAASMAAAQATATAEPMDLAAAATAHGPLEAERAKSANAPAAVAESKTQAADEQNMLDPSSGALARGGNMKGSMDGLQDLGGIGGGGSSGGAIAQGAASAAPPTAAATAAPGSAGGDSSAFAAASAAYHAKNYEEATRDFDALAASGDDNAALWAARSVREGSGCGAAVNRFDQLSGKAFGTPPGYDATFESGLCYKAMGSFDTARLRFSRLLTVPSHAARAQAELNKMAPTTHEAQPKRVAPAPAQQMNQSAY